MERIFLIVFTCLLTAVSTQAREPLPAEEVADIIKLFDFPGTYGELKSSKQGGSFSSCWTYDIEFETTYPDAEEPFIVHMLVYRPNPRTLKEDETVPSVVILPPIGGVNVGDKNTAKAICRNNMAAMIVTNDFANIESQANGKLLPPEDHELTFFRVSAAIKGIMTMIEDDGQLDPDRMGIFGASLGGILGSFVMATQPKVAAGYFVVAGGDVPHILSTSEQEQVAKIRRKRMTAEGFQTQKEYENYLRDYISLDPIDVSLTMMPETLKMLISKNDSHVPSPNQLALHKAFGSPKASYSEDDHVWTIINFFLGGGGNEVANFFDSRFKKQNPRPQVFDWLFSGLELAAI